LRDLDIVFLTNHRWPLLQIAIPAVVNSLQQSSFRSKIFVIVNGEDLETLAGIRELFPFVELILLKQSRRLGSARNAVIPFLYSKWTCFLDDDIQVNASFFSSFQKLQRDREDVSIWGGPNVNAEDEPWFAKVSGEILGKPWASGFSYRRYRRCKPGEVGCAASDVELTLCNLFLKTNLFTEFGFDEGLKGAEENYLWAQIHRHHPDVKARWEPALWAYHKRRETALAFAKQIFKFGFGRGENIRRGSSHFFQWIPVFFLIALLATLTMPFYFLGLVIIYITGLTLVSFYERLTSNLSFGAQLYLYPLVHFSYAVGLLVGLVFAHEAIKRDPSRHPSE